MFLLREPYAYRCMKQFSADVVIQGFPPQPLEYCADLLLDWLFNLLSFISNTFFQILFYSNTLLFKCFLFSGVFYILLLRGEKWFAATMYIKH